MPLLKDSNILVVGQSADLLKVLNGGWTYKWQGNVESYFQKFSGRNYNTIFQALKKKATGKISYIEGANFTDILNDIDAAVDEAQLNDVIILCIGEDTYTETPGNIDNMLLSNSQTQLANRLFATGKPVVIVFVGGRPRTITSIVKRANALLIAFLPGNRGGDAIADIIFGDYNPNGKLPITYPKGPNAAITYDYKPIEGYETWNGVDVPSYFDALFAFGHGLSYTSFAYSDLKLDKNQVVEPNSVSGSVTVKNIGNRVGKETVIVYLNDEFGSTSRPNKQLKFFKKITLNPGQSEIVNFEITRYDMSFINLNNERIVEIGRFNVYVQNLNASFELINKSSGATGIYSTISFIPSFFFILFSLIYLNLSI